MPAARRLVTWSFLWGALALVVSPGCTAPVRSGLAPGADIVRIDMSTEYTPGSPVAIDIENRGGDVSITVDPSLMEPMVRATSPGAGHSQEAAPWAAATLSPSGVAFKGAAPILRVLGTDITADKRRTLLELRVPACAGVRVRNQDGGVSLTGVSGAIDVQNGTAIAPGGPITMETGVVLDSPLLLHTSSGEVSVDLPAASRLDLEITTGAGTVSVQATGLRATDVKATKQSWASPLNGGGAPGKIGSDAGDIRVRLVK